MRKIARTSLWLYVFSIPWDHMLDLGMGIGEISRLFGILSILATIGAVVSTGSIRKPALQHIIATVFLVTVIASWFSTVDSNATAHAIRLFVQTMAVMWQVWELAPTDRNQADLLVAYVLGCYVSCLATISSFLNATSLNSGMRFAAERWDANDLAVTLALGLPMAAYLCTTSSTRFVRWICWGYFLVGVLSIALTASRAGGVVGVVAVISSILLITRGRWQLKLVVSIVGAGVLASLLLIVPSIIWDRLATITSTPDLNNRVPVWNFSLRVFAEHPMHPLGAGAYSVWSYGPGFVAHNTFLGVLLEEGVLGFLSLTALVTITLLHAWRLSDVERILWCALIICWIVGAMTLTWEQVRVTWFIFACAIAAIHSDRMASRPLLSRHIIPDEYHGGVVDLH